MRLIGKTNKAKLVPLKETPSSDAAIYGKLTELLVEEELAHLIADSGKHKRECQKKIYYVFYEYAIGICLRYAENEDDAIEMMNDGFLDMFKKIGSFKLQQNNAIAGFKAWLKQIMIYRAIDHCRKKAKQKHEQLDNTDLAFVSSDEDQLERISYKEILGCIQRLSPTYRMVFSLYVIDGFTHDEIAKQLNIAIGTSKSNLAKARQNLQQMLTVAQTISYEQRAV